jgi:hypothetical protein
MAGEPTPTWTPSTAGTRSAAGRSTPSTRPLLDIEVARLAAHDLRWLLGDVVRGRRPPRALAAVALGLTYGLEPSVRGRPALFA